MASLPARARAEKVYQVMLAIAAVWLALRA